ncbi:hypothetical protein FOXG_19489 [Fusarium oxysporum f. sp. lycopersici 4287]|uniref:DUF4246 domain-containing protein n=1 Tax=Fusarium oxysporum f. sp. lycopersici (strain 4287 / CBS 123668 / FGSC 9935 / NRRL 34936) TaxID=426428 RepID=A0A0J9V2P3_FUSO4|nr:hypothetical protein FOXG_19489 [Fusarium oxysporum f. sp. lycopersici 4287]KNB05106.1 hypothetical protein FOXG_19489 [Fusarium oxysporum f. sp. lycopersici 4287]
MPRPRRLLVIMEISLQPYLMQYVLVIQLCLDQVLEELCHEADIFEQAGLIPVMDLCIAALKFDKLLTDELVAEIKSAVAPLENVPEEQKDWHPGTHHQILDLVHREGIRDELMEERDARVKEFDSELISVEYRFCEH